MKRFTILLGLLISLTLLFIFVSQRRGCTPIWGPATRLQIVPSESQSLSFIALGDAGDFSLEQRQVALGIKKTCAKQPCDFVLYLGDNFYPNGLKNTQDPAFEAGFLKIYEELNLPFYAILGNHDLKDNPQAQIDLHNQGPWRMPDGHYILESPLAQLIGINSNCHGQEMLWAKGAMESEKPWTILFTHHPIYSTAGHGDAAPSRRWLWNKLGLNGVDLLLAGHDHDLEYLTRRGDSTQYLISGAGGSGSSKRQGDESQGISQFQHPGPGYAWVQIMRNEMVIEFFDAHAQLLYRKRHLKSQ